MAEIAQDGGGGKHKGKVRGKKMSTKIDFTPMVDLGFLLITFFMLATTLSKPKAMEINVPVKQDNTVEPPPVKESKVLTIIMSKDDKIYYYNGKTEDAKLDSTTYDKDGIRKVILDKKAAVAQQWGDPDETIVLIKPNDDSKYKNMVDILDEMHITGVKRYVLMDISKPEQQFIKHPEAGFPKGAQ